MTLLIFLLLQGGLDSRSIFSTFATWGACGKDDLSSPLLLLQLSEIEANAGLNSWVLNLGGVDISSV